jgi:hypothetical protein
MKLYGVADPADSEVSMDATTLQAMKSNPAAFRAELLIDRSGDAVRLADCMADFQREDFEALNAGWLRAMGVKGGDGTGYSRAWLERCRGSSKTSDIAVMVAYALAFAPRAIVGIAAAADADQAALIRSAIERLLRLNPWLRRLLRVHQWKVVNERTGSELTIISSDAPTSYGLLPDFVVCDELAVWAEGRGEELFSSLLSAVAKRENALLLIAGNAGWNESWQARVRNAVKDDPRWYFKARTEPAPWIKAADIEEQQRLLPGPVFDRLWRGIWSSGAGDALSEADLQAALTETEPMRGDEEGYRFFGGMDLSVKRDDSALVVVGRHRSGHLRLAQLRIWTPPAGGKIDLLEVGETLVELDHQFQRPLWGYDVFQAEHMVQTCKRHGIRFQEVSFSGKPAQEMASELIESFSSRRIHLWPHAGLLRDLRRLRIVERPSGWRLDAPRTKEGHCDPAIALSISLLMSRDTPGALRRPDVWTGPGASAPKAGNDPWQAPDPSHEHLWSPCNAFLTNYLTGKPR